MLLAPSTRSPATVDEPESPEEQTRFLQGMAIPFPDCPSTKLKEPAELR